MKLEIEKYKKIDYEQMRLDVLSECDENKVFSGDLDLSGTNLEKLPDLSDISVTGSFDCSNNNLTSLEGSPKKVEGHFNCSFNKITSLEGCPREVGRIFSCSHNNLTSLEGCPKEVEGIFDCTHNNLTSLEGCPETVGGGFYCSHNDLTSLEGCPETVGGNFYCSHNKLTSLEGCPAEIGDRFISYVYLGRGYYEFTEDDKKVAMENRRKRGIGKVCLYEPEFYRDFQFFAVNEGKLKRCSVKCYDDIQKLGQKAIVFDYRKKELFVSLDKFINCYSNVKYNLTQNK